MSVNHVATMVAAAEQNLTQAERIHSATQAECERRQGRLTALQSQLAEIAQRRQQGQQQADDASLVNLLKMDIDGLTPLVDAANRDAAQAKRERDEAANRLSAAQAELARSAAAEQAERLEVRLREIERTLVAGIAELAKLKRKVTPALALAPTTVFLPCEGLRRYIQQSVIPA